MDGALFRLEADPEEGCARRECVACGGGDGEVRWVTGRRCAACGRLDCAADWEVDCPGSEELLERT